MQKILIQIEWVFVETLIIIGVLWLVVASNTLVGGLRRYVVASPTVQRGYRNDDCVFGENRILTKSPLFRTHGKISHGPTSSHMKWATILWFSF